MKATKEIVSQNACVNLCREKNPEVLVVYPVMSAEYTV